MPCRGANLATLVRRQELLYMACDDLINSPHSGDTCFCCSNLFIYGERVLLVGGQVRTPIST